MSGISGLNAQFVRARVRPQQLPGLFMWLRPDKGVTLNYKTQSGTLSTTNGSTTVTGLGTTVLDIHVGAKVQLDASGVIRTVMTRSSNTSFTVDEPYTTTASGLAFSFGYVSSWTDMQGYNFLATQGTAAFQGLWSASAANGKPAVYLDGTTQNFLTNFTDGFGKLSVYMVIKDASTSLPGAIRYLLQMTNASENHALAMGLGTLSSRTEGTTQAAVSFTNAGQNWLVGGFSSGGSKHIGFHNRNMASATYSGNGAFFTPNTLAIGGAQTNRYYHGWIADILFYNEAHPVPMMLQNINELIDYYKIIA